VKKFGKRKAERYLIGQEAYTLHKDVRKRFVRRKTLSKGIGDLFQADLVDLTNISFSNDGVRYLLTCIDVFSKKAWAVAIRQKTASAVAKAFESILLSSPTPRMLQTDKGTEFLNSTFQKLLKKYNIHFYTSENEDIKAAVVERFNRTLKTKMYRYFTFKNTSRYVDVLQSLIDSYNSTPHRSIGMSPDQVNKENEQQVRMRLFPEKTKQKTRWHFNIGDQVRMASHRTSAFTKGYTVKWSRELFIVVKREKTEPPTYRLQDLMGETIKGRFYANELQLSASPELYRIEKILTSRRGVDGKVRHYVKWMGYPTKFNSWINEIANVDN